MKKVIIIRGPSGVGKSTYAKTINYDVKCSADNFFMEKNPRTGLVEYMFNPMRLGEVHSKCMQLFLRSMQEEKETIVVDNTFIHAWEFQPYVEAAKLAGYSIEVVNFKPETINDIRLCIKRNVHKVPAEVVAKMCVEFEEVYDSSIFVKTMKIER